MSSDQNTAIAICLPVSQAPSSAPSSWGRKKKKKNTSSKSPSPSSSFFYVLNTTTPKQKRKKKKNPTHQFYKSTTHQHYSNLPPLQITHSLFLCLLLLPCINYYKLYLNSLLLIPSVLVLQPLVILFLPPCATPKTETQTFTVLPNGSSRPSRHCLSAST